MAAGMAGSGAAPYHSLACLKATPMSYLWTYLLGLSLQPPPPHTQMEEVVGMLYTLSDCLKDKLSLLHGV